MYGWNNNKPINVGAYWEEYCFNIGDNDFLRFRCSNCETDAPTNERGRELTPTKCPKCGAIMIGIKR